jgi:formylmethanofuran dehydrogenase subunit E
MTTIQTEPTDWEKAVAFHGHSCPGLATGFKVSQIALKELETIRSSDEEIIAIVENDSCAIDAVQVITGCSIGKGNLIYRDYGKQVYTFACRDSGRAVRIAVKKQGRNEQQGVEERIKQLLALPVEDFCEVKYVNIDLPSKARIFTSHPCAECGEWVMEPRARVKDGKIVCIPCAENYSRGW